MSQAVPTSAARALLALDDPHLSQDLCHLLAQRGWAAECAVDAAALERALQSAAFDALVLDHAGAAWREPDWLVRGTSPVERPHLLVCCEPSDLAGLLQASLRVQAYVFRPAAAEQVAQRLFALAAGERGNLETALHAGSVVLDRQGRNAFEAGRALNLTKREFDLLALLTASAGAVRSRDQILEELYRWGQDLESNAIDVHVHGLRRKLQHTQIETVRGEGYRLRAGGSNGPDEH